jgi:hypothetical protein
MPPQFQMSDAKAQISASDEWYLFVETPDEPPHPYRSARAVWPLSTEELRRNELQAQSGNASALNNLGTKRSGVRPCSRELCADQPCDGGLCQERCIFLVGASGRSIDTRHTTAFAAHTAQGVQPLSTTEPCASGLVTAADRTTRKPAKSWWLSTSARQPPCPCGSWLR